MKKLLYVMSLLIIASMVLAACGPGVVTPTPTAVPASAPIINTDIGQSITDQADVATTNATIGTPVPVSTRNPSLLDGISDTFGLPHWEP